MKSEIAVTVDIVIFALREEAHKELKYGAEARKALAGKHNTLFDSPFLCC